LRDDPLMNYLYRSRGGLSSVGEGMSTIQGIDAERAARLAHLKQEHRDLDAAIEALRSTSAPDQLQLARLKKRKLRLKDQIQLILDHTTPDIIA